MHLFVQRAGVVASGKGPKQLGVKDRRDIFSVSLHLLLLNHWNVLALQKGFFVCK